MTLPNARAAAVSLSLAVLAGCGSGGGSASTGAASSTVPAPSATGVTTAMAEPAGPRAIAPADVQELVDAWLAAQNSGDLSAYLALYADRFEGVRRSGDRVARMDRKGWAADRTKMFAKKMTVTAEGVSISTAESSAQITFTQTWASASYRDVGPKRIVVVKERDGLRIAREEMLASRVQSATALPPHPPEELAFVIQDGGTRVVIETSPDLAWGEGAPELLADAVPFPTKRSVTTGKLPAALAGWAGKKLRLYGPAGPVCEATVGGLSLVGRVVPHFGEVARWHGTGDHQGKKPLSKAQIGRAAWDLAAEARPSGVVLAAELASPRGDCKAALWAQAASLPERKVAKAEEAPPALSKKVLEELRKLPEYKEIQKTDEGGKGPWDQRGKTEVVVMRHPSGRELAFISANAVEGCGGFQGNLSAVFEVNGDRLILASKPSDVPPEMPAGVIDPGDGKLEILFTERLLRGAASYDQTDMLVLPFLDCGC